MHAQQTELEIKKQEYLRLCQETGRAARPCLDRYTVEHFDYFISQLLKLPQK